MSARGAVAIPLAEIERVLEEACGLALSPGIRRTLADATQRAARELRLGLDPFLARLRAREPRAVTTLVEAAVVGETYFFRHPEQLDAIRQVVLTAAPRDRGLLIWSAGCATGEEPYTLAMELCDAGRAGLGDRIVATDVSSRALGVAREAAYGDWSMRRLDAGLRARHFEEAPPRVTVRPAIREMVEFRRHNLVKDPVLGTSFDLVVCRNVLIYFTPATAQAVVEKLATALRPGGALVLGPVETPLAGDLPLERIELESATVFRARGGRALHGVALRKHAAVAEPPQPKPHRDEPGHGKRERSRFSRSDAGVDQRRPGRRPGRPELQAVPPPAPAPAPEAAAPPPPPAAAPAEPASLDAAREAARRGDLAVAEQLARDAATRELCPEAWLLVSMAADARGDLAGAVDAARRALYLDPGLALGHAALVPLFLRLHRPDEAARARRNALEALAGLDDAAPLRGVEAITAGALRSALEVHSRPAGRERAVSTGNRG
jgi:chemotaxis protein methyltransferase CheR